ncbi:hypothetical protein HW555_009978 [Spodoptera exigua]|uniref:Uncharacterized protein n=1 Tax=Spodoptera exigua TaxID=7107 RepID=A0A835L1B0_SPOEX|nr:hypothetical protein HW555_009978 [Spodoptera exigua]
MAQRSLLVLSPILHAVYISMLWHIYLYEFPVAKVSVVKYARLRIKDHTHGKYDESQECSQSILDPTSDSQDEMNLEDVEDLMTA